MMADAKQKGFTLVELLVVIVVIGILAAASVTAYAGINRRAQNAQIASAMKQWESIMISYKTLKGSYYTTASGCQPLLGASASDFTDLGGCTATFDTVLMNDIRTTVGVSLPNGRLPDFGGSTQGIRYLGLTYALQYAYSGGSCIKTSDALIIAGDIVRCERSLP